MKYADRVERTNKSIQAERGMMDHANRTDELFFADDPYANRKPDYYVGIFNVSTVPMTVERGWAIGGKVVIPARKEGELYSKPYILPDMKNILSLRAGMDEVSLITMKGTFLAQDIVNTNDPNGNWKTSRPLPPNSSNEGNNYYERGLFWVTLDTPQSEPDGEALEAAINRLDTYYNKLVTEADQMYIGGPRTQSEIGLPHRMAAEALGLEDRPWHVKLISSLASKLKAKKAEMAGTASPDPQQ